jgi:phasin family protein
MDVVYVEKWPFSRTIGSRSKEGERRGKMTTSLMDHQKELLDQWGKLTKTGFDSLREVSDLNAKLVEKLSDQQREIMKSCLEASTKEAALISGSKDPKALLAGQAALAAEYNDKFQHIVRHTTEILEQCREELMAWGQKSLHSTTAGSQRQGQTRK